MITDLDRQLLLEVAEAIRFIHFDGTIPPDVMERLTKAQAALREHRDYEALRAAADAVVPFKRKLDPNSAIVDRIRGLPAHPATEESDADPHNPLCRSRSHD